MEYISYISQLIYYSGACGFYHDFLDRGFLLTTKLHFLCELVHGIIAIKSLSLLLYFVSKCQIGVFRVLLHTISIMSIRLKYSENKMKKTNIYTTLSEQFYNPIEKS
jgi:hypothetical protein